MVESLDELLRSLETDNERMSHSETSKRIRTVQWSELSLDLDLDLDHSSAEARSPKKSLDSYTIKCWPTLIGGTASAVKCCSSSANRTCLALHCRDCDFPVICFRTTSGTVSWNTCS